jgi:hypothetical protein
MTALRTVAFVLATAFAAGCGNSDTPAARGESRNGGDMSSDAAAPQDATPGPCSGEGQLCCNSGSLCAMGLTCSGEYCLRCGPAPAPLPSCTNVATAGDDGSTIPTAAFYPGSGPPEDPRRVIDDDVCTSWNYGNYGDPNAFWQVELDRSYAIEALTLWPKMTPATGRVQFLIQHKVNEGDAWTAYPTPDGLAFTLYDYQPWQTTFQPPVTARYVRITIQGTPSFASLREVGLYANCNTAR